MRSTARVLYVSTWHVFVLCILRDGIIYYFIQDQIPNYFVLKSDKVNILWMLTIIFPC